ncbi:MAG TPA: hypothetical protein DIV41_02175 [Ruminococcaceae bacterium]|jgi:cell division protein FtsL|nr:hypothetical protein [Oscillospiraceae bacterium]
MAYRNGSAAYDFELFEPRRKEEERSREKKSNVIRLPQEELEKNRRVKLSPVRMALTVLVFAVAVGAAGAFIYGQIQLTELTNSLSSALKAESEQQNVYTQLQMKSDTKYSVEAVQSYAEQNLGMKKIDNSQIETVKLANGDKAKVVIKDGDKGWLQNVLDSVKNLLS